MILRCHHYPSHQSGIGGKMLSYIDKYRRQYLNLLKSERYLVINCQMFSLLPTNAAIVLICHKDHISLYLHMIDLRSKMMYVCTYVCLLDFFLVMSKVTIDDWLIDDETSDVHHTTRYDTKNVWEHSRYWYFIPNIIQIDICSKCEISRSKSQSSCLLYTHDRIYKSSISFLFRQ